jgi:hypothetical protein
MQTDTGGTDVQERVEDGEEILDPDSTSLVLTTVSNTINNQCEHKCLDKAVRLLNVHPFSQ